MGELASQPADGLVIVALRIRDEERRQQIIYRLLSGSSERITSTVFEFNTSDWDDGLWDEEVAWLTDVLEGTRDKIIVWRFMANGFTRFTIGEGA